MTEEALSFPELAPAVSILGEQRAFAAKVFRRLIRDGKQRYLPMRGDRVLAWRFPSWGIFKAGNTELQGQLYGGEELFGVDMDLFVDAVTALGGFDTSRMWFPE